MTTKTIVTADRVWAGNATDVLERGFVWSEDGMITAVGQVADLGSATDDAVVIDLPGATVVPGLINAHVHLVFSASRDPVGDLLAEQAAGVSALTIRALTNLQAAASVGVTTVRDLGGPNDVVFPVRDAVNDGRVVAARVVASGHPITITGGHCHWFSHECDTSDEIRRAVRRQVAGGADLIKIFATGGNMTPRTNPFAPQYSQEQLEVCVEEATRLGMQVAAHAHAPEGIRRAASAKVSTIEHCLFETPTGVDFDPRAADLMATNGVGFVPTFGVSIINMLRDTSIERGPVAARMLGKIDGFKEAFRGLLEAGAPLIAGSDAGIPLRHHDDFPADLAALAAPDVLGLAAIDTLRSATSLSAAHLGLNDCGVLEPGRRADLLAVDGNPLVDIDDITRTRLVLCAGRPVGRGLAGRLS